MVSVIDRAQLVVLQQFGELPRVHAVILVAFLRIPLEATNISFGVLLSGSGAVWLSHLKFETVPSYVPTTGLARNPFEMQQVSKAEFPQGPVNLDFEN